MELGLPAALALVAAIGGAAWVCAEGLRRRRDAMYPCLGLAATALVGSHAAVDSPPALRGVGVTSAASRAPAGALSCRRRAAGAPARHRRRRRSRRGRGTTGPRRGGRHAAGAGPRAA